MTEDVEVRGTKSGVSDETETGTLFFPKKHTTFSYDGDGNTLRDARCSYSWNGENRLQSVIVNSSSPLKLEFVYDYMGRRVSKKVYDMDDSAEWKLKDEISFLYDGYKLIYERKNSYENEVVSEESGKNYYWVGEKLLAFTVHSALPTMYYVLTDENKNVCGLVSESGEVAAKYDYTPFGKLVTRCLTPNARSLKNSFLFSSEYHDEETGLVYYNYRYYNPELGRWMSCDPIGEQGGLNLYGMVNNNPVNDWDWLGLDVKTKCKKSTVGKVNIKTVTMILKTKTGKEFKFTNPNNFLNMYIDDFMESVKSGTHHKDKFIDKVIEALEKSAKALGRAAGAIKKSVDAVTESTVSTGFYLQKHILDVDYERCICKAKGKYDWVTFNAYEENDYTRKPLSLRELSHYKRLAKESANLMLDIARGIVDGEYEYEDEDDF